MNMIQVLPTRVCKEFEGFGKIKEETYLVSNQLSTGT